MFLRDSDCQGQVVAPCHSPAAVTRSREGPEQLTRPGFCRTYSKSILLGTTQTSAPRIYIKRIKRVLAKAGFS